MLTDIVPLSPIQRKARRIAALTNFRISNDYSITFRVIIFRR